MTTANINIMESLMAKIKLMDGHLLQRLNDYATGLVDGNTQESDWYDELSDEVKRGIEESEREIERGEYITLDQLKEKYKHYLND